jgi:uncharacterized membrane protein (UPF0127 family)
MRVLNFTTGKEIASDLTVADSILSRMKGLLGRKTMPAGEGLLIKPCKGIHTFGMRFPIDAIFLDNNNRVVAVINNLVPNRMTRVYLTAVSVLEVPAGAADLTSTKTGDQLEIT